MYDKFCKGVYYLFSKFLIPLLLFIIAIGVLCIPTAILLEAFDFTLKEALLFTALTWGLIFLLGVLTKVLNHGEELVRAEEEKKGAGKDE